MWKCPTCGRQFKRRHRSHSCVETDINSFFATKPDKFKKWYQTISHHLTKCGVVRVDTSISCVNFKQKSTFGVLKIRKNTLDIELILDRKDDIFPIIKAVQINKSQYAHRIRIEDPEELDSQLLQWMEEAYYL